MPLFFSFFFLFFFFFFLFLSLCFPRFFRPSLEEEEEDEEEEELEELEEEEEELDRGLLRALCLLLSVMQGEGEAGRPGGEEVNLRPLALACSRLRLTTSWQGFSTLWRGTFSTPQSLSAQEQGGQHPHLRPCYTKTMIKFLLHSVFNGLAQPLDSERLSFQIARTLLCPSE